MSSSYVNTHIEGVGVSGVCAIYYDEGKEGDDNHAFIELFVISLTTCDVWIKFYLHQDRQWLTFVADEDYVHVDNIGIMMTFNAKEVPALKAAYDRIVTKLKQYYNNQSWEFVDG